ncbi:MAG: hypothetical protein Q7L55_09360 [Actinomycetota bacterium]|nr:hypothetical protein [Actinomycetota bacterium]
MSPLVHFEIQVADVERAKALYTACFDWIFEDFTASTEVEYWGIFTGLDAQAA